MTVVSLVHATYRGGTPVIISALVEDCMSLTVANFPSASSPRRLKPPRNTFSKPPALHTVHIPSTVPGSGGQVAPGAEMMGQAQIVNALSAPFVLDGLFGEADAEVMPSPIRNKPLTRWVWMLRTT
jgi:hypothetical protein